MRDAMPWLQTTAEHDIVDRLKHLSWRSRWIILCTLERRMAVSCKISRAGRCLFGLSSWLSTRSSTATRWTRSTPLPGSRTIVPVLRILFSRHYSRCFQLSDPCRAIHSTAFVHHTALTDTDFLNQNRKFLRKFHNFNFYWYLGLDSFPK